MQVQVARPNRAQHYTHRIPAIDVLDGKPEYGQDYPGHDGDVGAPEAPGCAGNHWEGDVVFCADCAVSCYDEGNDEEGDCDDYEGFFVGKADGNYAGGEFPGCGIEGIGDPIC